MIRITTDKNISKFEMNGKDDDILTELTITYNSIVEYIADTYNIDKKTAEIVLYKANTELEKEIYDIKIKNEKSM